MASYDLTSYVSDRYNAVEDALEDVEAVLELVDTGKTIRALGVHSIGGGESCVGYCVYDT